MSDAEVQTIVDFLADKEDSNLLEALKLALEERSAVVQELVDWAVPDKAYVNARLMMENRLCGKIKSLSEQNGYGFIDCPDVKEAFGNDVFLHGTQVAGFQKGDEVSFAILLNKDRKPQAFDLGPAENGEDLRKKQYNDAKYAAVNEKGKGKGAAKGEKGDKGGATPRGTVAAAAYPAHPAKGAAKGAWPVEDWSAGGVWVPVGKGMDPYFGAYDPYGGAYDPYYGGAYPPVKGAYPADKGKGKGKEKGEKGAKGGKTKASHEGEEVPGVTDRRWEGVVKSFNEKTGFGFIECHKIKDMYGSDVFLHHAQHIGSQPGEEVTFGIFLNRDGKPQAQDVQQKRGVKRIRAN